MEDKILNEITDFCNECGSKENCPEEECVLYRIENIVLPKKKKFAVEIQETLCRIIDVEAESEEEALDIVTQKYKDEEIVLDANDFIDYDIHLFESDF